MCPGEYVCSRARALVCACVCVRALVFACVNGCVWESVCVCMCVGDRECVWECVCVCMFVWERRSCKISFTECFQVSSSTHSADKYTHCEVQLSDNCEVGKSLVLLSWWLLVLAGSEWLLNVYPCTIYLILSVLLQPLLTLSNLALARGKHIFLRDRLW